MYWWTSRGRGVHRGSGPLTVWASVCPFSNTDTLGFSHFWFKLLSLNVTLPSHPGVQLLVSHVVHSVAGVANLRCVRAQSETLVVVCFVLLAAPGGWSVFVWLYLPSKHTHTHTPAAGTCSRAPWWQMSGTFKIKFNRTSFKANDW